MTAQSEYPGEFRESSYVEHVTYTLRIIVDNLSDDFSAPTCSWLIESFDSELEWQRITSSPKRRYMIFERALDTAREEAKRIQAELENPHKPDGWNRGGGK